MAHVHNPNCDGSHCKSERGEVRLLPMGTEPNHGNLILCHECYWHEIVWRNERNRELSDSAAFRLPKWSDLAVYRTEEN